MKTTRVCALELGKAVCALDLEKRAPWRGGPLVSDVYRFYKLSIGFHRSRNFSRSVYSLELGYPTEATCRCAYHLLPESPEPSRSRADKPRDAAGRPQKDDCLLSLAPT